MSTTMGLGLAVLGVSPVFVSRSKIPVTGKRYLEQIRQGAERMEAAFLAVTERPYDLGTVTDAETVLKAAYRELGWDFYHTAEAIAVDRVGGRRPQYQTGLGLPGISEFDTSPLWRPKLPITHKLASRLDSGIDWTRSLFSSRQSARGEETQVDDGYLYLTREFSN